MSNEPLDYEKIVRESRQAAMARTWQCVFTFAGILLLLWFVFSSHSGCEYAGACI